MQCPDEIRRDSWNWVGLPTWEPLQIGLLLLWLLLLWLLWLLCVVVVVVRTECSARMSVHTRTQMQLIKMNQCQCTGPFGWTDQPEYPHACSLRRQVPSDNGCKTHPTPSRGKRLRGTPASLPTPTEEGDAIFSISSALGSLGPD